MILLISIIATLASLALMVPVLVFTTQAVCAFIARNHTVEVDHFPLPNRPRLAILVPAHNEATNITPTIEAIKPQLHAGDRLLVVADNCSDDTAAVAQRDGAEVVIRTNADLRGKGYALDYGIRHMAKDAPEIVVILDADCILTSGSLEILASACVNSGHAVQALYLMKPSADAESTLKQRIAEFAWTVKNWTRPLGFAFLGLPCQLTGTGTAFRWEDISVAQLANGHLAEDMKLGVELAAKGVAPLFCPEALVTSAFPTTGSGTLTQRTRWEHGHLGIIFTEAPKLLLQGIYARNRAQIAMALDVLVPPLALLFLLINVALAVTLGLWFTLNIALPLGLAVLTNVSMWLAIMLAWLSFGRSILSLRDLSLALIYVGWKIPIYLKFVFNKQIEWVRTHRDD